MKIKSIVGALSLFPVIVQAQVVPAIEHTASIPPGFVENPKIQLSDKDKAALDIVRKWKKNPDKPKRGPDGSVKYLYGATMPTMLCTTLQVCAIKFQPGEVVKDVTIGDSPRWQITPARIGDGPNMAEVAIVKPAESGLKTSAIITTDRRMYTISLVSTKHEWIPVLSFDYPEDAQLAWKNYRAAQEKHAYATTLPTGESIDDLDFGFRMSGDSPKWKPKRVYIRGTKTIIQFPMSAFENEAPVLVSLKGGGMFSDPSKEVVNYRRDGDKYVVDGVFDRLALIMDVGSDQVMVTIDRAEGEQ